MSEVRTLIVDADDRVGDGGFLAIRRLRLRNQRADGSVYVPKALRPWLGGVEEFTPGMRLVAPDPAA